MNQQARIGLIFGVCALVILVLAVFHLRNLIRAPFTQRPSAAGPAPNSPATGPSREVDTDRDGLNDWDEVYQYGTSAYVPDTDSDGLTDGEEVRTGKNPNCKEGQTCGPLSPPTNTELEAGVAKSATNDILALLGGRDMPAAPAPSSVLPALPSTLTVAQIRVILEQSGMKREVLAKIDDATLELAWREVLKQQTNVSLPQLAPLEPEKLQLQLARMSADQLRSVLILLGASNNDLASKNETQLRELALRLLLAQPTPSTTP